MSRRRVLICGGRDYHDRAKVENTLRAYLEDGDIIIHGAAPGADALSGDVAGRVLGHTVEVFPANWSRHGSAAGPIRNQEMLASGIDLVIAFDGGRGTEDMVKRASKAGIEVITVKHEEKDTNLCFNCMNKVTGDPQWSHWSNSDMSYWCTDWGR